MFDDVWLQLLGRHHQTVKAVLTGYRRVQISNQTYPGLKQDKQSEVAGVLVFDLNSTEINKLDQFEGRDYQRQTVRVISVDQQSFDCDVYLIRPHYQHILTNDSWEPEEFRQRYLKHFLHNYSNW